MMNRQQKHHSYLFFASASVLVGLFLNLFLFACTPSKSKSTGQGDPSTANQTTAKLSPEAEKLELITHGQKVYSQNCVACHNPNPKLDGSVGPAIYGSSLELVSARVLRAAYPPGYKPKRPSGQMPAFAGLEKDIPALHAFLNQ